MYAIIYILEQMDSQASYDIFGTHKGLQYRQNTNIDDLLELDNYCKPNLEVWHTNDVLLSFILMINGKTNELWTNTNKSNIIHPYKGFYNKSLSINEGVYRN